MVASSIARFFVQKARREESQGKISKEERKPVHFCDLDIPLVVVEEALLLTASVRIPRRRHPPLRYQNKKEGDPKLLHCASCCCIETQGETF